MSHCIYTIKEKKTTITTKTSTTATLNNQKLKVHDALIHESTTATILPRNLKLTVYDVLKPKLKMSLKITITVRVQGDLRAVISSPISLMVRSNTYK